MIIPTTRFGEIEVRDEQLVRMPDGLLGFEPVTEYCLFQHAPESPFHWLQATQDPSLAFVVVNPFDYFPNYEFELSDGDAAALSLESAEDIVVLSLVTFNGPDVTTNLVGPIVMNRHTHAARQIVLALSPYSTQHSLVSALVPA